MASILIYEVECTLDPDIVADYDAWLPGHVRDVLACPGFDGASIESPETPPGERQRRRIRYRIESAAALDRYLENDATRLRALTAQRFGGRLQCERRVYRPHEELAPAAREPRRCLNCGTVVTGRHCAQCGQAADVHVLSMREVAGDVTHSLLHLDSRVWRTLRLLVRRPGELTREFIAGRHQQYLPPFRLYLAVSILFFALSALLPDSEPFVIDAEGHEVLAPVRMDVPGEVARELEAEGIRVPPTGRKDREAEPCRVDFTDRPSFDEFEKSLSRACDRIQADGGARFFERFAAAAPKLMFLFLPLIAAVALLFYWRPRRLYTEHLVLFFHNHAFTFLLMGVAAILGAISDLGFPFAGAFGFAAFLAYCWLPFYVYRSMRVVYANGHALTSLKFLALSTIYFVLLGVTMLAGLVYAIWQLS